MNTLTDTFAIGFKGRAVGITINPVLKTRLGNVARCSVSASGWQVYDATQTPLSIADGATTTLDLLGGTVAGSPMLNPLGEAVSATPFVHVFCLMIWHDDASLAANIEALGGASSNKFQGPWSSTAKATLVPGGVTALRQSASLPGWVVSGTAKNIDLKNIDGTGKVATVRVFIAGTTT